MTRLTDLFARFTKPKREPSPLPPQAIDTQAIVGTIERALSSAGLDRDRGLARDVRSTIDDALAKAGLLAPGAHTADPLPTRPRPIDVVPVAVPTTREAPRTDRPDARDAAPGQFLSRSYTGAAGTRQYKLYVPPGLDAAAGPAPLIVMLHGCTQSPDDFAAGTRMNALAGAQGCFVAYPAQTARDNGSKCWNWFRSQDQARDRGEPSLIAGIVAAVAADHRIDPQRVFVAGLSAGAAMAVILAETHPDVFAAVGAHSGLPYAAAHDVASAFAVMQRAGTGHARGARRAAVRTIVFHGDADQTVDPRNGLAIVRDAVGTSPPHARTQGAVEGGRAYTRETFGGDAGHPRVEHWTIHGAGHAWSGGSAQGTYTDPRGPDASAEMLRFFLAPDRARG